MDELVKLVSERTGLSEEMSQQAVEVVAEYLKDKMPDAVADQIDTALQGGSIGMDDLAKGGLGGLLGG